MDVLGLWQHEAGGSLTGGFQNAGEGKVAKPDPVMGIWVWNPSYAEWQKEHLLKSGDTLWNMAGKYYGDNNRWKEIAKVPENKSIVGSDGTKGYAGDILIIPSLKQIFPPFGTPGTTAPDDILDLPTPPGLDDPSFPASLPGGLPPAAVDPTTGFPPPGSPKPDWWPAGVPYYPADPTAIIPPGVELPPGAIPAEPFPEDLPGGGTLPTGGLPIPVSTGGVTPAGASTAKKEEAAPFWTTGKIVAASLAGVSVVGLTVFLITRKKRRSNPRRRRRY